MTGRESKGEGMAQKEHFAPVPSKKEKNHQKKPNNQKNPQKNTTQNPHISTLISQF